MMFELLGLVKFSRTNRHF